MGRGTSKAGTSKTGGNSGIYMTKSQAKDYIVSLLTSHYTSQYVSHTNPVLMVKDGKYAVAKNWDDANYAKSLGWKVEELPDAAQLGAKARARASEQKIGGVLNAIRATQSGGGTFSNNQAQNLGKTINDYTSKGDSFVLSGGGSKSTYRKTGDNAFKLVGGKGSLALPYTGAEMAKIIYALDNFKGNSFKFKRKKG